ncbi:MAG: hypothetical protein M1840_005002 [Geoglossum simile]|nr:MAG: hypothetical protein M1840_005002 [Geoglossum simile]
MGLKPEREATVTKFRRESIFSCDGACGCEFDKSEETEIQRAKFRKSSQREAVNERLAIKRAFAEHEKSTAVSGKSRAQSDTAGGQVHSQLLQELFANSSHPPSMMDALREGLSENARTTLSGGQSQRMSTAGSHRVVRQEKKLTRASNPPSEVSNGQGPAAGKVNQKKTTSWLRRIFRGR